jgi:hypothetical protein
MGKSILILVQKNNVCLYFEMYLREEAAVKPYRTLDLAVWDQHGWRPKRSEGKFRFSVFVLSIG